MMTTEITYAHDRVITPGQLAHVYRASGIVRPVDDLDRMARMIERAEFIYTAWDGDRLVGVARALTDYCYCCYLSCLAVDREYQGRGIGRELLRLARERAGEETIFVLLAGPGAESYYPHLGTMEKFDHAFVVHRAR